MAAILDAVRRRLRGTDVVAHVGDHEIAALLAHADIDAAHTTAEAMREAAEGQRVATANSTVGTAAGVAWHRWRWRARRAGIRRGRAGDARAQRRRPRHPALSPARGPPAAGFR
jgi:GGDEF domain-containing protein